MSDLCSALRGFWRLIRSERQEEHALRMTAATAEALCERVLQSLHSCGLMLCCALGVRLCRWSGRGRYRLWDRFACLLFLSTTLHLLSNVHHWTYQRWWQRREICWKTRQRGGWWWHGTSCRFHGHHHFRCTVCGSSVYIARDLGIRRITRRWRKKCIQLVDLENRRPRARAVGPVFVLLVRDVRYLPEVKLLVSLDCFKLCLCGFRRAHLAVKQVCTDNLHVRKQLR